MDGRHLVIFFSGIILNGLRSNTSVLPQLRNCGSISIKAIWNGLVRLSHMITLITLSQNL